jgi:peroxiredoxin
MRALCAVGVAGILLTGLVRAEEPAKQAPKVVLQSADGKKAYDLAKLTAEGPVLVRLTCACTGCDAELPFFQKLQAAYAGKGFKTLAIFQEKPADAEQYIAKNGIQFLWVADPTRQQWKSFDATVMPTNILIDKSGRVVKFLPGCTRDGKNAQLLSAEIARLLETKEIPIAESKPALQK